MSLIGKKIGMTRIFTQDRLAIPVTIIKIAKHQVNKIIERKKFRSVQCSYDFSASLINTNKQKKHKSSKKLFEFKDHAGSNISLDKIWDVNFFSNDNILDITGISKGKGFAGTIKRWNFSMQDATHGNSLSHRAPGSIGQNQTPGRVFKGKKMAGRLGGKRVTVQNIRLVKIDVKQEVILVKGAIPGSKNSNLIIKPAIKQGK